MKDTELRLISELMKNSRRSDRELAKAIGVSQPTVSRTLKNLEKKGYVKEYTMIPSLHKLGYEIMAVTFVKRKQLNPEERERAREITKRDMKKAPTEIVLFQKGISSFCDGIIVSFHKDYSSYAKLRERAMGYGFVETCDSFLVDLGDEVQYRPFTLSTLADNLLETEKDQEASVKKRHDAT